MSDKLVKSDYSNSITLAEKKIYLQQKIAVRLLESINQFSFINAGQWTLLMALNVICLTFILLASMWVI